MITIRQLLTHTSGLPSGIRLSESCFRKQILQQVAQLTPMHPPGSRFLYSDVDFIILGHLVEIITQQRFDLYVTSHIFKRLKMAHTFFMPPYSLRDRIAPTEIIDHALRWGEVHDPTAYRMGGISGNAGLFSTAHDLAIYTEMLLNGGHANGNYILGPLTIAKMTSVQTPANLDARGLGWDIDSAYSNRGVLLPVNSFGHTGWTGTSLWIDPSTHSWIIILTSRTHPSVASKNQLIQDRRAIANIIGASLTNVGFYKNTGKGELTRAYSSPAVN